LYFQGSGEATHSRQGYVMLGSFDATNSVGGKTREITKFFLRRAIAPIRFHWCEH